MSQTKTAEKPRTKGKTALRVICVILAAILVLCGVGAAVSAIGDRANTNKALSFSPVEYDAQLTPELDEFGNYTFVTDRPLKVLQLTDVHIGGGWMSLKKDAMAINAVAAMVTAEKPDLVVVTGDVGYPVPFQAGTFNNKVSAKIFAQLMERLGVYWTLCFGNHDTEAYSYYNREKMSEFYADESMKYCLYQPGPAEVDGCGNQIITVRNTKDIVTHVMYLFDSHSYTGGDYFGIMWKYDNIHANQVEWYKENVQRYEDYNKEIYARFGVEEEFPPIVSTAYMHIPLTEYKDAWYEYIENGEQDTADVKYVYGVAGEGKKVVYCGIGEDDLFEAMQETGSTKGVFCGHDHLNFFSVEYKGIALTYGRSVDYLAYPGIYKLGSQRGCTVIEIAPDGSFDYHAESYYQEKYTALYEKEPVTMQEMTNAAELPTEE